MDTLLLRINTVLYVIKCVIKADYKKRKSTLNIPQKEIGLTYILNPHD